MEKFPDYPREFDWEYEQLEAKSSPPPSPSPSTRRCRRRTARISRPAKALLAIVSIASIFVLLHCVCKHGLSSIPAAVRKVCGSGKSSHRGGHGGPSGLLDSLVPVTTPAAGFGPDATSATAQQIPLEAHVMSKCPDARDCLQKLILPAMEKINDKVDFRLSAIGSLSNDTSEVLCKHGPAECIGDILLLCAANLPFHETAIPARPDSHAYPRTPTIRSLGFANCLISSFEDIPDRDLVEDCALEHGIDFGALNACASQQDDDEHGGGNGDMKSDPDKISGIALLRKSFQRNIDLGIQTSCTVRLDERTWCVRDGGEWKDCTENSHGTGSDPAVLVKEIEALWAKRN